MMDPFVKKVEKTVRDERLFEPGSRVVAGVSGGPDSVALISSLHELSSSWRLGLVAAHLNHGLRGKESDDDEKWVRELTGTLGLSLVTKKLRERPEGNLESSLRDMRYQFLLSVADQTSAKYIAVGHHADDLAETVLINLVRGAGSTGLGGIAPSREAGPESGKYIVRPLIKSSRAEIIDYLNRSGRSWREDSTNLDPAFLRNRVRHELMPLLESMNPGIREALTRTAQISRYEAQLIQAEARSSLEKLIEHKNDLITLDLNPLRESLPGLRMAVYREAIRVRAQTLHRITLAHLEAMDHLVMNGPAHGSLDLPGLVVRREYDLLHIGLANESQNRSGTHSPQLEQEELSIPGSITWKGPSNNDYTIAAEYASPPASAPDPAAEAWLDPAKVKAPLEVRVRRPGDRYRPAGMAGSRKLKDIMNELKVPPRERDCWPLFVDRHEIVWVPGFRPAERAKLDPETTRQIKLTISPPILPLS